ncbi:hypothetical protein EV426DRAFT_577703 [Tirmania nivea]|nr:hypothetical protein EV426DRAFT_577703 [Tirmania nivea]
MARFNFCNALLLLSVVGLAATMPTDLDKRYPAPNVEPASIVVRQAECKLPNLVWCCFDPRPATCRPSYPLDQGPPTCPPGHNDRVLCCPVGTDLRMGQLLASHISHPPWAAILCEGHKVCSREEGTDSLVYLGASH